MMSAWIPAGRRVWLLLVGLAALLACLWLAMVSSTRQVLLSYLFAFVFFCGLSTGSLAMLMVHAMTGGAWGHYLRPALLAAARVLPLMALLVIPLLIGMGALYPWADHAVLARDAVLRAQSVYLDKPFFVIRTVVYFVIWLLLLLGVSRRLSTPQRLPRIAAPGLILFALTTLLAGADWTMSLQPHWSSSTWGMMFATGWMLSATALAVLCTVADRDAARTHPSALLHDLGNLMLMLVLGWSYLVFMQYLTVWIGNRPSEVVWYVPRTLTSWVWLGRFLIAFHFALPFAILLSRAAKRRRAWIALVAGMLVVANLADMLWLVVPGMRRAGFALHWSDACAVLGVGGLWLCAWRGQWHSAHMPVQSDHALHSEVSS